MSAPVADITSAKVLGPNLFGLFKGYATLRTQRSWTIVEEGDTVRDKVEMLAGAELGRPWKPRQRGIPGGAEQQAVTRAKGACL